MLWHFHFWTFRTSFSRQLRLPMQMPGQIGLGPHPQHSDLGPQPGSPTTDPTGPVHHPFPIKSLKPCSCKSKCAKCRNRSIVRSRESPPLSSSVRSWALLGPTSPLPPPLQPKCCPFPMGWTAAVPATPAPGLAGLVEWSGAQVGVGWGLYFFQLYFDDEGICPIPGNFPGNGFPRGGPLSGGGGGFPGPGGQFPGGGPRLPHPMGGGFGGGPFGNNGAGHFYGPMAARQA